MLAQFLNPKKVQPQPTQTRIILKLPQNYCQEPIVFQIGFLYRLEVSILGADLGDKKRKYSQFDLLLRGSSQQIENALAYLSEFDVNVVTN